MRRAAFATACVVAVSLAGCGGDGGAAPIDRKELPSLVLQPRDLPRIWVRFDYGRQIGRDTLPGRRADARRFGRTAGWKARFRRAGTPQTRGPLLIESRADLFDDGSGAESDLNALEAELDDLLGAEAELVAPPPLGDEGVAATLLQQNVRYYLVAWRRDNLVASLVASGFEPTLEVSDVVALARKQDRRITAAAS